MRRRDCVRDKNIPLVPRDTSRSQQSAHIRMSSFSAAYCGHTVRHHTMASRELVDVKPRRQTIYNTHLKIVVKQ